MANLSQPELYYPRTRKNRKLLNNLELYFTPEEKQQFADAPEEWLLQIFGNSDVAKYGPHIRRVLELVEQFGDVDSLPYQQMIETIDARYETEEPFWFDFNDEQEIKSMLKEYEYDSCVELINEMNLPVSNLYTQLGHIGPTVLMAVQVHNLNSADKPQNKIAFVPVLGRETYLKVTSVFSDCGFSIPRYY